jgi:hypothetical protein
MPKIFQRTTQPDVDLDERCVDDHTHFTKAARGSNLRWCEDAVFAEQYDEDKWCVTSNRETTSWCFNEVFDAIADGYDTFRPHLELGTVKGKTGVKLAGKLAVRRDAGHFDWNGWTYNSTDYKGKEILIPDQRMWGWYEQRKVLIFKIFFPQNDVQGRTEADYDRVVFGTKDDKYTHYPEKYGFMGRRTIARLPAWQQKYEQRLQQRNPRRGQYNGKWMAGLPADQLQQRWDEINEESGLRVKHAPCILMINRYIKTWENFVKTYLAGSKGTGTGVARPDHVTDHEIYRMFTGKERQRILDNALFADDTLVVVKIGKTENAWWNKDQIARHFRIQNQN